MALIPDSDRLYKEKKQEKNRRTWHTADSLISDDIKKTQQGGNTAFNEQEVAGSVELKGLRWITHRILDVCTVRMKRGVERDVSFYNEQKISWRFQLPTTLISYYITDFYQKFRLKKSISKRQTSKVLSFPVARALFSLIQDCKGIMNYCNTILHSFLLQAVNGRVPWLWQKAVTVCDGTDRLISKLLKESYGFEWIPIFTPVEVLASVHGVECNML